MNILCLDLGYAPPFSSLGNVVGVADETLEGIDLVVFPGGPDVPPSYYGAKQHPRTFSDKGRYQRFDKVYEAARKQNIPLVGICGGGQYLNVKAGGRMVQHVSNHAIGATHPIVTEDGEEIQVTSTHHQMMCPKGTNHHLVAWAEHMSEYYEGGEQEDMSALLPHDGQGNVLEPDVIYFPDINALSIQYHPEYMAPFSRGFQYAPQLVSKYLLKD